MNIDEMEAGREMDALIAEKVMGWTRHSWASHSALKKMLYCTNCGKTKGIHQNEGFAQFCNKPICGPDNYSTDIAAAWEVVEMLEDIAPGEGWVEINHHGKAGAYCRIWRLIDGENGEQWNVLTEAGANGPQVTPLVICRAALKAVTE